MVRDRDTLEPATEETAAICDRMLELGVVIQPTGERQNILKTKPPLCLDVAARRLLRRRPGPGADRGLVAVTVSLASRRKVPRVARRVG